MVLSILNNIVFDSACNISGMADPGGTMTAMGGLGLLYLMAAPTHFCQKVVLHTALQPSQPHMVEDLELDHSK